MLEEAPRRTGPDGGVKIRFRSLERADLPLLQDWLCRPHVSEWWGPAPSLAEVEADYGPLTDPTSNERGYIALLDGQRLGFIQSYGVMGCGGGWWAEETDPGARGIDQFIAGAEQLGRGLGRAMVRSFVTQLFVGPTVTRVQADPAPENQRAIRCYLGAGFLAHGEVMTPDGTACLMVRSR